MRSGLDLADLSRTKLQDRNSRSFPMVYAPVMMVQDGKKGILPMRYQCHSVSDEAQRKDGSVSALKQASGGQMGLGGFCTGNVVQLDGGRRIRLDDMVDYWPLTGVWRALEKDADGNAVASGRGMPSVLHFLKMERERAGRPVAMPVPQPSARRVVCDHCHQPAELHLGPAVYPDRKDLAERKFWVCWACDAWVGCPSDSDKPFGTLAKE